MSWLSLRAVVANEGGATNSYDRWLAWKHGAQLRDRALRSRIRGNTQPDPARLDWGHQATLEKSVLILGPRAPEIISRFYTDLFERLPGVRGMFPADMTVQRERLLAALLALVHSGPALAPVLDRLGRDHRKFGVREVHYAAVGQSLVTALAAAAGEHWTENVAQAWLARYNAAAAIMTAAADADDQPPFWYGTVVDREVCGQNVAILRVRPHYPYPYTAGQYATIESPRLPRVWRAYSMAAPPHGDRPLEFHVRGLGRSGLSDVLVRSEIGDTVRLGPPQGSITLPDDPRQPRLFVAGGTGWSTVKALLGAHAGQLDFGTPCTLLAGFRPGEPYDPGFRAFLRELPDVRTRVVHDAEHLRGALSPDELPGAHLEAYVAGPPGLVDTTVRLLTTAGVAPSRIHHDNL